mmetsp:Transcript_88667/g.202818  ORF Transcript_88667/g.202818 Transcript_88667/m.202818 type:complete len:132 (-) Transcript_88667:151-546(-)
MAWRGTAAPPPAYGTGNALPSYGTGTALNTGNLGLQTPNFGGYPQAATPAYNAAPLNSGPDAYPASLIGAGGTTPGFGTQQLAPPPAWQSGTPQYGTGALTSQAPPPVGTAMSLPGSQQTPKNKQKLCCCF